MSTVNVIGVQFRRAGKIYHFTAGDFDVRVGDEVVVDTDRGPSLAEVTVLRLLDRSELGDQELKPIIRKASQKDLEPAGKLTPEYVEKFARDALKRHDLNIRILKGEILLGGNKVIVYFSAPGRVDFRELVKDLATGLYARVELKQVGARDEAKLVGGLGICGREFCCSSFLREFVPVSIKMAKNQNLALNPTKVSGGCGRLLCCLTYENDTYSELRRIMPGKGAKVRVNDGGDEGMVATVIKSDLINQLVMIISDAGNIQTLPVSQLEVLDRGAEGPAESRGSKGPKGAAGGKPSRQASGSVTAHESDDEVHVDEDLSEAEAWAGDINLEDLGFESGEKPASAQNQTEGRQEGQQHRQQDRPPGGGRRRGRRGGRRGGNQ
jgi:cell fate regulator YaaT (PSP1 superfamily)